MTAGAPPLSLTWEFPDTPIIIGVTLLITLVLIAATNLGVRRMIRYSQHREERRNTGLGARAAQALAKASGIDTARQAQRTATLATLVRSIAIVTIVAIAILTVMSTIGVPLTPLLASAGVGGVALGFGAQSLVRDFLAGLFMIFEDQLGVGDVVDVGNVTGTVEEVTLRVTRIRDATGTIWYVRNGEIIRVGNLSQGFSTATVDIPVAYQEDPVRAVGILRNVAKSLDADPAWKDELLEEPQVLGVESVQGTTMTLRILVKTPPNKFAAVQRELRERAMIALGEAGVRGPSA